MKDIPWYEWLYAITEEGRVWIHENKRWPYWLIHKAKFKKPDMARYLRLILWKDWEMKNCSVSRLVAITYIPNPNNLPVVRHLDNNKYNNHVSNLEWCTQKTNVRQAWDDGLCKLTEEQKENNRQRGKQKAKKVMQLTKEWILCKIYESIIQAQRETGIDKWNIRKCILWKYKHAGGFEWRLS